VRPTRQPDRPQSFVAAVQEKYASEATAGHAPVSSAREITISGKVAEEVGFDKIRRKLANVGELKIVILDGMRVAYASGPEGEKPIRETCPRITELDLSRDLLTNFGEVVDICAQLPDLRSLRIKYVTVAQPNISSSGLTRRKRQSIP
jgi:tubulin-specific chaperone E